jgi:hypothetical protein
LVTASNRPARLQESPDLVSARRFLTLPEERRSMLLRVSDLLDEISFGTVMIVQQDGKVIQIETSEKIRLR